MVEVMVPVDTYLGFIAGTAFTVSGSDAFDGLNPVWFDSWSAALDCLESPAWGFPLASILIASCVRVVGIVFEKSKPDPLSSAMENSSSEGNFFDSSSTASVRTVMLEESRAANGSPRTGDGPGLALATTGCCNVVVGLPRRIGVMSGNVSLDRFGGEWLIPTAGGGDVNCGDLGGSSWFLAASASVRPE